jgi:hypothetical protein
MWRVLQVALGQQGSMSTWRKEVTQPPLICVPVPASLPVCCRLPACFSACLLLCLPASLPACLTVAVPPPPADAPFPPPSRPPSTHTDATEFLVAFLGCLVCVGLSVFLFQHDFVVLSVMLTTVTFWVLSLAVIKRLRKQMINSIFALPAILYLTTGLTIALRSEFAVSLLLLTVGPFLFFFVFVKKHIARLS